MKFRYKITLNNLLVTHVIGGINLDRELAWILERAPGQSIKIELMQETVQ